ncbi:cytochrome c5 [alpha proteobacterium U9-1i]|nr:cytochrome c5 [alpha proteobacterium U9-1i]
MRGLVLVLALAACGETPDVSAQSVTRAAAAAPANARLAQLYDGSCKTCHAVADSGAPLTNDRAAWDARWTKGMDTLVEHTISGFNGMPAGGQCFTCTPEDYRALIAFMAGREG